MDRYQAPAFCPNCGKPQSSWLPACRSCGRRFADSCPVCRRAIPVGNGTCADHVGAPIPAAPPVAEAPGGSWAFTPQAAPPPPPPPTARAGSGRRAVQLVVAAMAFVVASVGVGAVLSGKGDAEARARKYVSGTGDKEFFAADLQFRATFPTIPERSTQIIHPDGRDHELVMYMSDLGDSAFGVGAMDLPRTTSGDLNLAVNGIAAAVSGHVESSQLTTFEGFPAAEFLVSVSGRGFLEGLIVRAPDRLYTLQVGGVTNPPGGYDRFRQSFHLAQT
ncbi:MAG TPA: hypothetical protein VJ622_05125 [Acidimicrobiia bacterium]|nr:hypothetical protein [Acidimicrobiia bacterium]